MRGDIRIEAWSILGYLRTDLPTRPRDFSFGKGKLPISQVPAHSQPAEKHHR
jgi:hypothetical protein